MKVTITPASVAPIRAIYDYAKEHPQEEVLWVIGARQDNEEDFIDISSRTKAISKYPNMELRTIVTPGGVSGTAARNALKVSKDKFKDFLPDELSDDEVQEVFDIVSIKESLNEHASYTDSIDIADKIAQLTNHMLKRGMNIEPLPTMELIDGDSENASDFLGKTAYYDPENKHIVLYTEGRHPKDIVRSYAHEMIHHIQNLEGRLGDVNTTDTTEDGHLTKLEAEANLKGTMTFRGWTDSITGNKLNENKELDNIQLYSPSEIRSMNIPKKGGIYFWWVNSEAAAIIDNLSKNSPMKVCQKRDVNGEEYSLVYVGLASNLHNRVKTSHINQKHPSPTASPNSKAGLSTFRLKIVSILGQNIYAQKAVNDFQDKYMLVGFIETEDYKEEEKKFIGSCSLPLNSQHNTSHPFYKELKALVKIAKQKGLDESIVGQKIVCDNCGWSWNIDDGGDDMFTCHECGSEDNQPIVEEKTKDPFGLNAYAAELGKLREDDDKKNYKIYLDLDGVVADFDQRFRDLSGMSPSDYETKNGKNAFWDFIDVKHKVAFWVGIPPMPQAKTLVDYVSQHDYEVLTAPSIKKQSVLGKNLWVRNHIGKLFPSKPKVNFKPAKEKHKVKPNLTQYDILIDDKASTISNWESAGGTGILFTSTPQTIEALKQLGL